MRKSGEEFRQTRNESPTIALSSSSTNGRNPMINSVVLSRLFELCDLSDLLEHRLVCKEWYSASVTRIRNEISVQITTNPTGNLNWSNFNKEFYVTGAPFRCFRVTGIDFMTPPSTSTEPWKCYFRTVALAEETNTSIEHIYKNMEIFWEEYGQYIRKLDLYDPAVFSVKAFKKVLFEKTPNLEELKIDQLTNQSVQSVDVSSLNEMEITQSCLKSFSVRRCGEGHFPIEWKQIFIRYPKIQKLELYDVCQDAINALQEVYESLDEIPLKELTLTGLHRLHARSPALHNLLQLPKLKLSKLEMDVNECYQEERNILQVALRTHGARLKELVLQTSYFAPDSTDPMFSLKYDPLDPNNNFPFRQDILAQLTLLDLSGALFQTFRFLEQTPNLQVLRLCLSDPDVLEFEVGKRDLEVIANKTKLPFLKKFIFTKACLSEREMEALVRVMPNVEHFDGDIDGSALRVICIHWRKLRVLEMSGFDIDDEVITGILDGCAEDTRLPNITDLKELQKLKIWNGRKVGDSSVRNAILQMPNLRSVDAGLSLETSQEAVDALRRQFPSGQFDTEYLK